MMSQNSLTQKATLLHNRQMLFIVRNFYVIIFLTLSFVQMIYSVEFHTNIWLLQDDYHQFSNVNFQNYLFAGIINKFTQSHAQKHKHLYFKIFFNKNKTKKVKARQTSFSAGRCTLITRHTESRI